MTRRAYNMNLALWLAAGLASAVFLIAGGTKVFGGASAQFLAWGYSAGFAVAIGMFEVVGAIALLSRRTAGWAAAGLMAIMAGAAATHVIHGEYLMTLVPSALIAVLGFMAWGRGLSFEIKRLPGEVPTRFVRPENVAPAKETLASATA